MPAFGSVSAMVKGILSPFSVPRKITKLPGLAALAMKGASTIILLVLPGISISFLRMVKAIIAPYKWLGSPVRGGDMDFLKIREGVFNDIGKLP